MHMYDNIPVHVHSPLLTQLLLLGSVLEQMDTVPGVGEAAASDRGVPVQVTGSAKDTRLCFFCREKVKSSYLYRK